VAVYPDERSGTRGRKPFIICTNGIFRRRKNV